MLDHDHAAALKSLTRDFSAVWENTRLAHRDRKRMVRLMIEDVTLLKERQITCHIRFKGGTCKTLNLPLPQTAWEMRKTSPHVVAAIDKLLDDYPDYKLAEILTEQGMTSGTGQLISPVRVKRIRMAYRLQSRWSRLRQQGKLSAREFATKLGISVDKVRRCRENRLIMAHEFKKDNYLYNAPEPDILERVPQLKMHARLNAVQSTEEVQYAT